MRVKCNIRYIFMILLIGFSSALYGCTSRVSNNDIYDVEDLMELSEEVDENEQELYASANRWKFDRHYNENLFFNDYSKEIEELTDAYSKIIDKRFREHQEVTKNYVPEKDFDKPYSFEYFFDLEIEFYNSSLEAYRLGNLTINQIASNDEEHIRKIYLTSYSFMDADRVISGVDDLSTQLQEEYFLKNIWIEIVGRSYDSGVLKKTSLKDLAKMEFPIIYLENNCSEQIVYAYPMYQLGSSIVEGSIANEYKKKLEKRYNEKFVLIKENRDNSSYMFALQDNLDLVFDAHKDKGSKYPSAKVQQMVSKHLYEILKENNASERIVFFTTPAEEYDDNEKREFDNLNFDFNQPFDDIAFVNEVVPTGVQTTFYYLYDETSEKIDYEMLYEIIKDSYELYPTNSEKINFDVKVYFVNISEDNRKIAVELFKENDITANTFPRTVYGVELSDFFISRVDHEGFRFLDVYGDIYYKYISYGGFDMGNMSANDFVEKYTYGNDY